MIREWIHGSVLDSRLYTNRRSADRNADLYFELSVYLNRVEPVSLTTSAAYDSNGNAVEITSWPDAAWHEFKYEFVQVANRLNNRFWLVPPEGFSELDWPEWNTRVRYRPNVKCGLQVLHSQRAHARFIIDCYFPKDHAFFRSSMYAQAHYGQLSFDDSSPETLGPPMYPDTHHILVILHELGHVLGLSHPNNVAGLRDNNGACNTKLLCYGKDWWQRNNMMGLGHAMARWNAWPWRDRIRYHTGRTRWGVTMVRPAPVKIIDRQLPAPWQFSPH
jgi:hypothetical protein